MVNDTDPNVTYSGSWSQSTGRNLGDYGDDLHYLQVPGESATFAFNGTGVAYLSEKLTEVGKFDVYVDGVAKGTYDAYFNNGSAPRESQQMLYEISGLPYGRHTLQLVMVDGQYLQIDAFRVETPSLVTPNAVVYDVQSPGDISISLGTNAALFGSVTNGQGEVLDSSDYTVNNGALTLSQGYLSSLTAGEHDLTVDFLGDYGDSLHWTDAAGASATYSFTGSSVSLIGPRGPEFGTMDIYIDGVLEGTADGYSSQRLAQQVLFTASSLDYGSHTIKVVNTGSILAFDALRFDL
jgi:hypothetical protein